MTKVGLGESLDVRLEAEVAAEWSWAAALADIPQIRAVTISSSSEIARSRLVARVWDGDVTVAEAMLGQGPLPSGVTSVKAPTLRLNTGYMATREERSGATVEISLLDEGNDDAVLASFRTEVDIQPPDLWWRQQGGPNFAEAILVSFVRPNAPVVAQIAREALEIIRTSGHSSEASFDAYQSKDPAEKAEKADLTAAALAQAIRDRRIGYSEPPPAWDYFNEGQRIRPHESVAAGGLGTCLDTTVLMAACFEHVGLNPVMVLVAGHVFCGYWRFDNHLPEPVLRDRATVANLVQSGALGLVETTALTISSNESIAEVMSMNERRFFRDAEPVPFRALIDVVAARRAGVIPLPVVVPQGNGDLQVVEYRAESPAPRIETVTAEEQATFNELVNRLKDEQPARLRMWKSELLSLNATSPLLNLPSNAQVQPILLPPSGLGMLEDALHLDRDFEIRSGFAVDPLLAERGIQNMFQASDEDQIAALESRLLFVQRRKRSKGELGWASATTMMSELRSMARKAKDGVDERGMNPLFLVLGMLRWGEGPGGAVIEGQRSFDAPMVLVPVRLTGGWRGRPMMLSLDSSSHVTPNHALLEWLRREHGVTIPGLAEPAVDKAGIDLDQVFENVRSTIAAAGLSLQVVSQARLALLDVGAFRMWKDLQDHGSRFLERPLVHHLVSTPTEPYLDPAIDDTPEPDLDDVVLPVAADAAQARAVAWARQGRTFVLQGPPGTGKSQTITNMIAACVSDGQRVLFVAEKQTALSVVRRRLDAVGLGTFSLNLHHEGSSGAQVRDQLTAAIRARAESDPAVMEAAERQRRTALHHLRQYPVSLHETNQAGYSAYSARDQLIILGDGPSLDVSEDAVARQGDAVAAAVEAVRELPGLAVAARPRADHPWRLAGPASASPFDVTETAALVTAALDALTRSLGASPALASLLQQATSVRQWEQIAAVCAPEAPEAPLVEAALQPGWTAGVLDGLQRMETDAQRWAETIPDYDPAVVGEDLSAVTQAVAQARGGLFIGRKGRVAAALSPLARFARSGLPDADGADEVLGRLAAARSFYLPAMEWVRSQPALSIPLDWNPLVPGAVTELVLRVRNADAHAAPLREGGAWADALRTAGSSPDIRGVQADVLALIDAWSALIRALTSSDRDLEAWRADRSLAGAIEHYASAWRADVQDRLISLQRWQAFRTALEPLAALGLQETADGLADGSVNPDVIEEALERGIARASLEERLHTSGLDVFDGAAHQTRIDRFAEGERTARELWPGNAARLMIESRDQGGAIGSLQRELSKTKGMLGTRAILRQHGAAVQAVTPIVLTSPSNAVDLIEPGSLDFDVVIFDEASQIPVPESIGALGRANAAIVVGDSKQMPPTKRVGAAAAETDEVDLELEEEVVEDQESILSECELARVPTLRLDWHYRSQDEALIAFSNAQYYDGALSSFPTPTLLSESTGVSFRRVQGHYIRSGGRADETLAATVRELLSDVPGSVPFTNTNIEEALAIVDEIEELVRQDPRHRPSIGVVTFNEQQRILIASLLQSSSNPDVQAVQNEAEMGSEDVLFVKALEQVQGDERDIVLFSVAFSKQANGKIPLNFGRLSTMGGERRLNVAVTRARRRNIMFCSFDPQELEAERSSYSGVKHLKEYLLFAKGASGPGEAPGLGVGGVIRDRHRDEIAEALRDRGLHVRTDVGMSDFRLDLVLSSLDDPDVPVLPVLLDGESWRRRTTVGDREVLPVQVLTGLMGWPRVARIWWPMWVQNRAETLDAIVAEFAAAMDALAAQSVKPPVMVQEDVDLVAAAPVAAAPMNDPVVEQPAPFEPMQDAPAPEPDTQPEAQPDAQPETQPDAQPEARFEPVEPPRHESSSGQTAADGFDGPTGLAEYRIWIRDFDRSLDEHSDRELDDLLVECVEYEGPVLTEVAFRRVVRSCGSSRLGSRVRERLTASLTRCLRGKRIARLQDSVRDPLQRTLYAPGSRTVIPRTAGDRALEDVPRSELQTVINMFPAGLDRDDLYRRVIALYGRKSLTGQAASLLDDAKTYNWELDPN